MANIMILLSEITQDLKDMFKKLEDFWIKYDSMNGKLNMSDHGLYGMTYMELKNKWMNGWNSTIIFILNI